MIAETTTSVSTQPPPVSRRITEQDRLALARVDDYLPKGVALKRWWDTARAADKAGRRPGGYGTAASTAGGFTKRFRLTRTFNPADESFGFFGDTLVGGAEMPIMGNFQKMFYDRPRTPPGGQLRGIDWMRDQLREFVLRYFMRVSSFKLPEAYVAGEQHDVPGWLAPFSLCTKASTVTQGFGFKQLFYKRRDSGEIGEFPEAERFAIVDLREIGEKYEWVLLNVDLFDFKFTLQPLGPDGPELSLPLKEGSYLILSSDFVEKQENPAPGVLGRYGFGYAFIKNPAPGVIAFGPGEFDAAFETIVFEVHDSIADDPGLVDVEMVFVVNRPERIVNVSLDPLGWGMRLADLMSFGMTSRLLAPVQGSFKLLPRSAGIDPIFAFIDLANLLTCGRAKEELCLSREQIEFTFLVLHFMQHYTMANGSLLVWREVADWTNPAKVPRWAKTGTPVP
ncbi:MAG TPA: hypothetical protein VHQ90_24335 [Thermoanaerobaculia bacterium]|nr:hypothetical protein [Thermoanaerobaculia bacterium]